MGYINPGETGFYYLGSRYYDPVVGRFINSDTSYVLGCDVVGLNLFAYCGNNPVNRVDYNGKTWYRLIYNTTNTYYLLHDIYDVITYFCDKKIDENARTDAEKELAKQNYYDAYQVNKSKKIADEYTEKTFDVNVEEQDNNAANAYRHAMWSAVMTDRIGVEKAKAFGDAHEKIADYASWKENCEMDLHNNALGRNIAIEYEGQGYDVFSQKILEAIKNGEAIILEVD